MNTRSILSLKKGDIFRVVRSHVCGPYLDDEVYRFSRVNNLGRVVAWPAECRGVSTYPSIFHETTNVYRLTKAEVELMEKTQ